MQTSETIRPDRIQSEGSMHRRIGLGTVHAVQREKHSYICFCEGGNLSVQFVTDEIVRLKVFRGSQADLTSTAAVLTQAFRDVPSEFVEDRESFTLSTEKLRLVIAKKPFQITTFTSTGEPAFDSSVIQYDEQGRYSCTGQADAASHFYGLGEKTSYLDKRGERYEMWNSDVYAPHVPEIDALYVSIPYLVHLRPASVYGIFLDNPGKTVFDMRSETNAFSLHTLTGDLDFYIIHGSSLKDVTKNYSKLTGTMPLPPKWALGYHQSRYSYMSQSEVLELARTFREKEIPCDAIYLDIHYMDGYRVFTFDPDRFPDSKGMMTELAELGFHVVPIVDPGVKQDARYSIYRDGVENDHFCRHLEGEQFIGEVWPGKSAFPDFTDDRTAKWWGKRHEYFVEKGIRGIWNDMNEPAVFNELKTMDLDIIHKNNGVPKTHEELHNLYGYLMSKATYEGLKEQLQGERPFILTRAGYAGIQRYAAVWTGDNRSFWEHLEMSMPMVMNLGLSGVPFAGPDIGGFAHHASGELLARWTQMGVFFPFCRNHSALDVVRQEPWSFGAEVEAICRDYISLRYRWMPYFYSLFYESSQSGLPVMRPLALEYPDDAHVFNLSDQFLVGEGVLVAPVYRPSMEYRTVYLPKGIWYDYWTGERHEGGRHILVHAPLNILPLFIKAGTILPETAVSQHLMGESSPELTFNVYAGAGGTSVFQLYEDDGNTFVYQTGAYNLIKFEFLEGANQLSLRYRYQHRELVGSGEVTWLIRLLHVPFTPSRVLDLVPRTMEEFDLARTGWAYDDSAGELLIKFSPEVTEGTIEIS
ncbi:MAG: alpha-glucosidase [Alicyclobacillus sp. RIFOXYA1_FULL_53_8]|nr:MAG: alpha-glucosidase [Alicyclobacillus sp. RIFOXYA1_FULL_53_8]